MSRELKRFKARLRAFELALLAKSLKAGISDGGG